MRLAARKWILVVTCILVLASFAASAVRAAHLSLRSHAAPTVRATLTEMRITVSPLRVPAGKVTFVAHNLGSVEHELIVVPFPQSGKLSVTHFRANESAAVGEVHELKPGETGSVTLMLKPGRYALICNVPGHYQLGMHTTLQAVVG
jgi:uncharacterized cupredoxin-like copper-binding protein